MHSSSPAGPASARTDRRCGFRSPHRRSSRTAGCSGRCTDETRCATAGPAPTPQPSRRPRARSPDKRRAASALRVTPSRLQLFHLRARNVAVRPALEVRVEIVEVVHDGLAGGEAHHALFEPAVAHGLDEVVLAERLQAFNERWADQAFLVGAVATIACSRPPCPEALHLDVIA